MMRLWVWLAMAVAMAACVTDEDEPVWSLQPGDRVPEFEVTLNDGTVFSSRDDRPAVIVFFNTTCPDCQAELPRLQQYYETLSADTAMVCIAREESAEPIARFWAEHGLTMPYSPQPDRRIYSLFASSGIPRVYAVGADGVISSAAF